MIESAASRTQEGELIQGTADPRDCRWYDRTGRRSIGAAVVRATGIGAARVRISWTLSGPDSIQVSRTIDVVPYSDVVWYLAGQALTIEVLSITAGVRVSFGLLYELPSIVSQRAYLLQQVVAGGPPQTTPDGAVELCPDAADTWSWTVTPSTGVPFVTTATYPGTQVQFFPVLGQQFSVTLDTAVHWRIALP